METAHNPHSGAIPRDSIGSTKSHLRGWLTVVSKAFSLRTWSMSSMKRDVKKKAPPRPEARFRFSICELLPTKDKDSVSSAMFSDGNPRLRIAAHWCIQQSMSKKKNAAAVSLGRKGGKATAKKLTAKQRKESARKAALARWRAADAL